MIAAAFLLPFLPFVACLAVFSPFDLTITPQRDKTRSKRLF